MKWVKAFNRPHSLQKDLIGLGAWLTKNPYYSLGQQIYVPQGKEKADFYFIKEEWDKLMQILANQAIRDSRFLPKHIRGYRIAKARLLTRVKRLAAGQLKKISAKELYKRYRDYHQEYYRYSYFFYFPWALNKFIDPFFRKKLKTKFPRDYQWFYLAIATPTREVVINRQYKKLLQAQTKGRLKRVIIKHAEKYGWLKVYNYADTPWAVKDFLQQIADVRNPQKRLKELERKLERDRGKYQQALRVIKTDKNLTRLARLIHEYVFLRTERVDTWRQAMYEAQPFYRELERRLTIEKGAAIHLTIKEIEAYLEGGQEPDRQELNKRLINRYITHYRRQNVEVIADPDKMKKVVTKFLKLSDYSHVKQFTGRPAFTGRVRGRAKIVMGPNDISKMKKGEIIVSNMTHPDYILAIKRARAIVTDEGGVTCHAAIISRELEIPCVIGTKIATEVLKDGDRVEVDAKKGVVKKL